MGMPTKGNADVMHNRPNVVEVTADRLRNDSMSGALDSECTRDELELSDRSEV